MLPTPSRAFVWYVIIGAAKTLAAYALYAAQVLLGVAPQIALLVAHVIVTIAGYRGHAQMSFGVSGWGGLGWYVGITTAVYGLNALLLLGASHLGLAPLPAQALCQIVTIPLGFGLLKWALGASSAKRPT